MWNQLFTQLKNCLKMLLKQLIQSKLEYGLDKKAAERLQLTIRPDQLFLPKLLIQVKTVCLKCRGAATNQFKTKITGKKLSYTLTTKKWNKKCMISVMNRKKKGHRVKDLIQDQFGSQVNPLRIRSL
jgi:hypothetical protein